MAARGAGAECQEEPTGRRALARGKCRARGPLFQGPSGGFAALGYVDGHTITLHHRFPNETPELFRRMAADLVALKIDALVSVGNVASPYAKNATQTIPVVFILVADPIGSKLVDSLARPSGNVTGLTNFVSDVVGRRLQLLKELIPEVSRIGQLVNPNAAAARLNIELTREAAAQLGFAVKLFEARSVDELERAFDAMAAAGMQAVTVNPEGLAFQARELIAKLALARRLALCAYSRETRAIPNTLRNEHKIDGAILACWSLVHGLTLLLADGLVGPRKKSAELGESLVQGMLDGLVAKLPALPTGAWVGPSA
jgi:putative ABC transport system substrate-binding protein